jgi:hypothetical protein
MAQNRIPLDQIINDFMFMHGDDEYVNDPSITKIKVLAKRGVRELGFDVSRVINSELLPINESNMTASLPDDFVNWLRVGYVGKDGLNYIFTDNPNIAQPMVSTESGKVDAKNPPERPIVPRQEFWDNLDTLRIPRGLGGLYGLGGGRHGGAFRINLEQNRIELDLQVDVDEILIEYIADQSLSDNPFVHPMIAEALDRYIYNELVKRSTIVPYNEKIRADNDYKEALKLANSRMRAFRYDKALLVNRKNFRLSPKF